MTPVLDRTDLELRGQPGVLQPPLHHAADINTSPGKSGCPPAASCAGRTAASWTRSRGRAIPEPWRYPPHGRARLWLPWRAANARTGR